jgi:hypothetical protein
MEDSQLGDSEKIYLRNLATVRTLGATDGQLFCELADAIPWYLEAKGVDPEVCKQVRKMVATLKEDATTKLEERSEFFYRMKVLEFAVEDATLEEYMASAEAVILEAATA